MFSPLNFITGSSVRNTVRVWLRHYASQRPKIYKPRPVSPKEPGDVQTPEETKPPTFQPIRRVGPDKEEFIKKVKETETLVDAIFNFRYRRTAWPLAILGGAAVTVKNFFVLQRESEYVKSPQKLRQDLDIAIATITQHKIPDFFELFSIQSLRAFLHYDEFAADIAVVAKCVPQFVLALDKMGWRVFNFIPLDKLFRNPELSMQAIEFGILPPLFKIMLEQNDLITGNYKMFVEKKRQSFFIKKFDEWFGIKHYSLTFSEQMLDMVAMSAERHTPESQLLRRLLDSEIAALSFAANKDFDDLLDAILVQAPKRPETVAYTLCSLAYWDKDGLIFDPKSEQKVKECLFQIAMHTGASTFAHRLALQGLINFKLNKSPHLANENFQRLLPRAVDPEYAEQTNAALTSTGYTEKPSHANALLRAAVLVPYLSIRWLKHGHKSGLFYTSLKTWFVEGMRKTLIGTTAALGLWLMYTSLPLIRHYDAMKLRRDGVTNSRIEEARRTKDKMHGMTVANGIITAFVLRFSPFIIVPELIARCIEVSWGSVGYHIETYQERRKNISRQRLYADRPPEVSAALNKRREMLEQLKM